MKLPHTVCPFAFEILTNVLLDESFQSESGSDVDRKDVGDEIHPLVVGSCRMIACS